MKQKQKKKYALSKKTPRKEEKKSFKERLKKFFRKKSKTGKGRKKVWSTIYKDILKPFLSGFASKLGNGLGILAVCTIAYFILSLLGIVFDTSSKFALDEFFKFIFGGIK